MNFGSVHKHGLAGTENVSTGFVQLGWIEGIGKVAARVIDEDTRSMLSLRCSRPIGGYFFTNENGWDVTLCWLTLAAPVCCNNWQ